MVIIKKTITIVGKEVEKLEPSYIAYWNIKRYSCFGLIPSLMVTDGVIILLSNSTLGIYPRKIKTSPHKNSRTNVENSLTDNSQDSETIKISIK